MNLRTFTSSSMAGALKQVKREMGADAVVLHTRTFRRGGIMGFGARTLVEITAADGREVAAEKRKHRERAERERKQKQLANQHRRNAKVERMKASVAAQANTHTQPPLAGELIRQTYAAARAEFEKRQEGAIATTQPRQAGHLERRDHVALSQPTVDARSNGQPAHLTQAMHNAAAEHAATHSLPTSQSPAQSHGSIVTHPMAASARQTGPSTSAKASVNSAVSANDTRMTSDQLQEEVELVKRMVAQMLRQQREQAANPPVVQSDDGGGGTSVSGNRKSRSRVNQLDMPEPLFDQYLSLLKQEVSEDLAEEIIRKLRGKIGRRQMEDPQKVRETLSAIVADYLPTDEQSGKLEPTEDGRPRVIALIGPTGVGKTTTIAKLAASFKLKQKKRVGLITLDTYRIAAVDQLKTYANIIGVPLTVVSNEQEMAAAVSARSDCDVVLIDTAGRSQKDDPRLEQLGGFLTAANPHEVHLVLSSTCTQSALLDAVAKFSKIRADRIIFTKLDEAVTYGVLLNVSRKINRQLSFVTTGQEVPHHIEPGRSDRLAALVLGGEI